MRTIHTQEIIDAVKQLCKDFPVIVVNDITGGDLYEEAERKYKKN
jgi:tartrate dehydratase beta subunit/fumarate hydratase class I family protein